MSRYDVSFPFMKYEGSCWSDFELNNKINRSANNNCCYLSNNLISS